METNRRPASPFIFGREFGSAVCAPLLLSAAVAHLWRSAALHAMKSLHVIALGLLLVGCRTSTPHTPSLTADRAGIIARQLANEKAHTLYACRPFGDPQSARFVEGYWVWHERRARGAGDIEATVELGADGSPRRVDVILLDSRGIRAQRLR